MTEITKNNDRQITLIAILAVVVLCAAFAAFAQDPHTHEEAAAEPAAEATVEMPGEAWNEALAPLE